MNSIQTVEVACDSCEGCETAPVVSSEAGGSPRPLYEVPPADSSLNQNALIKAPETKEQDFPEIKEINPAESGTTVELNAEPTLAGGAFKPLKSSSEPVAESTEKVEAPKVAPLEKTEKTASTEKPEAPQTEEAKADEKKDAIVEAEKPIDVTPAETPKEVVKEVVEEVKPAEVKPIETPVATETNEEPKPKSIFKPGQPFKPTKDVKPTDSSWNDIDANFYKHGDDENYAGSEELALDGSELEIPSEQDPVSSFFGHNEQPEAKPLQKAKLLTEDQSATAGRVVLQAHPVERSVVYMPPAKSVSNVVPALRSSFKAVNTTDNWLRNENHVAKTLPPVSPENLEYPQTDVPSVAVKQVAKPAPVVEPQVEDTLKPDQPRKLAVRLKAIPMDETNRRRLADARFREHQPVRRVAQNPPVEKLIAEPAKAQEPVEVQLPKLDIRVATPPKAEPAPKTARALELELATPPWRMK